MSLSWAHGGRAVHFWRQVSLGDSIIGDSLYVVPLDRSAGLVPGPLASVGVGTRSVHSWDLHPDGDRFVAAYFVVDDADLARGGAPPRIVVVLNWLDELDALLAERR